MSKFILLALISIVFTSCVVSKKKYLALEQELTLIKADLKDDDNDGIPNYIDLEPKTETLAEVDKQGRTLLVEKIVDIDQDGVLDVNDFCPTIKGIVAANGCPDKDGDGVYDFLDLCPNAAGDKKVKGCPPVDSTAFKFDGPYAFYRIRFNSKTEKFDSLTSKTVDGFLNHLFKTYQKDVDSIQKVVIFSHTDNALDSLKSIKLSAKRGQKVLNLLVKKGFPKDKIEVVAEGSSKTITRNDEKGGKLNNRVEIIFRSKEEK